MRLSIHLYLEGLKFHSISRVLGVSREIGKIYLNNCYQKNEISNIINSIGYLL